MSHAPWWDGMADCNVGQVNAIKTGPSRLACPWDSCSAAALHVYGHSPKISWLGGGRSVARRVSTIFQREYPRYKPHLVSPVHRCRLGDCAAELGALLKEEKLAGASLLILANKQDLPGALSLEEIKQVSARDAVLSFKVEVHCGCTCSLIGYSSLKIRHLCHLDVICL